MHIGFANSQMEHIYEVAFNLETLSSNLSRVCRAEAFS